MYLFFFLEEFLDDLDVQVCLKLFHWKCDRIIIVQLKFCFEDRPEDIRDFIIVYIYFFEMLC